jgi:glycosyltransferase involved in cell wall biosynthesis
MKLTFAVPDSGCAYWRAKQPARMIKRLGLAEVGLFETDMSTEEAEKLMLWGDVIIQQSVMGIDAVATLSKLKDMGKAVVGDYDDLSFALSPFNPAYKTLGLNEIKIKHDDKEEFLWEDGKNGFDIKANYFRYRSLQDILKLHDIITTTTQYIKDKYSEFNPNIVILPNSIDFNLFKPFTKKENKQIRIGWTASDSHYSEIWMMKRIMRKILNKYKNDVRFVMLGNLFEMSQEFEKDSYERHDFIGLDTYPLKQAALNLDIGLCPLDNIEFNKAKSQLKWSEYASLRIPSVCSKLEPYDCVEDGITGLLAKNEDEFFNKICELVEDSKLRKEISDNAYDKNYEDYNLEKNAILWVEAYEQARDKCELRVLDKGQLVKDTPKILQTSDIR